MKRSQSEAILSDLKRKMVFLSGPRQVGKSWLARELAKQFDKPVYLNWDNRQDRELIDRQAWPGDSDLIVFEEIHKMPQWKNYLKGIYDTKQAFTSILVTGSARLETFRQSGDSLAGRYFHHRLMPIGPAEAAQAGRAAKTDSSSALAHFLERGGFPEPFLAKSAKEAARWRRTYLDGLILEDILSFENVRQLRAMHLLVELLRARVASPLSYQSLAEDIGTSPNTVKRYIEILEALYIVFRIYPHNRSIARSLAQQPKLYFFDIALVEDGGARLENHVALALLKELYLREDTDGARRELRYLRTKEGREVDFLVTVEDSPRLAVEVKTSEREIAPGLSYFCGRYGMRGLQLVADLRLEYEEQDIEMRKAQLGSKALEPVRC
ncbi:MAG TPA: ATP-binding protein [Rectinemataceae bacterium]